MSKKYLVAGATGKTGRLVVSELQQLGAEVVALARESSDTGVLSAQTEIRHGDLTSLGANLCADIDVVVFAAGSGGDTDADMTDKVDRDGAKALVDRAKAGNVERFVMLSSIGADDPDPNHELSHYLQAKHEADEYLKASGLTYAILRPVALTDDARTGEFKFGADVDPKAEARRADVAAVLAQAAAEGSHDGQAVNMQTA